MKEIWKDVNGYEGYYKVSNFGNVKSLERIIINHGNFKNKFSKYKEKILKPFQNKKGYLSVHLTKNCKGKTFLVHRLVAEAFIPNINRLPLINHKNEITSDNRAENLEWCTNKYNVNYGSWRKNQSLAHTNNKKVSKKIFQLDLKENIINVFPSIAEANRQTHISHIGSVANGKRNQAGGFYWKFEEFIKKDEE